VRHRKRVYETWGFDKSMTSSRGITALFAGTPGTGKTMVAGVIARELGLDVYRVDVSRITSKWIGETEKNLGSLFDAAEDGQVMLLFDEADSLFGKRTEAKTSNDRYANMETNYLLQRLDTFEGIAILTTNFGTAIDPASRAATSAMLCSALLFLPSKRVPLPKIISSARSASSFASSGCSPILERLSRPLLTPT
jgi:SpoVK/Ycf46/Vps4 family AAA+-type ATPase